MATLDDLLALLPDNQTGAIDAADLRTIVTTLWDHDVELDARIAALENTGTVVTVSGLWQINPTPGAVPGTMQVTSDTGNPSTASWFRFATIDQTNTDQTTFLLAATALYAQQQSVSQNWARFNVVGTSVQPPGTSYVEVPVEFVSSGGVSGAQWQSASVVLSIPTLPGA